MRKFLNNKKTLKSCRIFRMLATHAGRRHLSFHTPGHKVGRWDITELSFSDNLASPSGCIALAEEEIGQLKAKRVALKEVLDAEIAAGRIIVGSEPYYEMVDAIYDVDAAIDDTTASIEEFQNSINDITWDNFEKLLNRIGYVQSEINHVYDLMSDAKAVDDAGNWTDEGITALAMQAQAMEAAMYKSKQYGEAIEELEATRERYSEEEYVQKLNELTEGQWECIEAYEAAKDAIVDLNSTRIDAVKDGIQKEIEAYEELIALAKEELNAKKRLHDFEKQIGDQTRTISDLERQIAARVGSTDAATIAERKALEAQLLEAKEALNESYFDNAITAQEEALDDELNAYNAAKDAEIEALDVMLDNVETLVAESFDVILANTSVVVGQLNAISDQYGIDLSETLTNPWYEGGYAIDEYTGRFVDAGSAFTDELDRIKDKWEELRDQANEAAQAMLSAVDADVQSVTTHTSSKTEQTTQDTESSESSSHNGIWMDWDPSLPENQPINTDAPSTSTQTADRPAINDLVTVKPGTTQWARDGGNGYTMHSWVPGSQFYVRRIEDDDVLLSTTPNGANTGWVKLKDLVGYSKGTLGVPKDEWAWLDEIGEEIVLNAGPNGRLSYLTKGTSVIPADISENLMALGRLDPSEVLQRSKPNAANGMMITEPLSLDMSFGSLVHVDTVTEDTLPKLKSMIQSEFDNLMRSVNNGLKKYVR